MSKHIKKPPSRQGSRGDRMKMKTGLSKQRNETVQHVEKQ